MSPEGLRIQYMAMLVTYSGVLASQISGLHLPRQNIWRKKMDDLNEEIRDWGVGGTSSVGNMLGM